MIEHVRLRAEKSNVFQAGVYVATCDTEIYELVKSNGGNPIMTSKSHSNGTSRVAEAIKDIDCSHVLVLQADEPLITPKIMEEFVDDYFDGPTNEYMQYQAKALHDYKSVSHVDGTARVQVVKKDCGSVLRDVLEEYYEQTGVPMLLNTSLNIRGKPMVNTRKDAWHFEDKYGVKVFS